MRTIFYFRRYHEPHFLRFISVAVIFTAIIMLSVSFYTSKNGTNIFRTGIGGDYPVFYVAGKILNEHSPAELYNMELQFKICKSLRPNLTPSEALPNPYPPFLNLLFKPLALLPYVQSYILWLVISGLLYIMGLFFIKQSVQYIPSDTFITAVLLALSFEPFIIECWLGGQISSLAFFLISLTIYLEKNQRPVASGIVLGLCLYKTPLLFLIIPFMLISRRMKILVGFSLCAIFLILFSIFTVGWQTCLDWLHLQFAYSKATTGLTEVFRTFKYVDIISFFRLLIGSLHFLILILIIVLFITLISFLIVPWKNCKGCDDDYGNVAWAFTITFSLIFNVYIPIYDTILIVIGLFLTVNGLYNHFSYDNHTSGSKFNILLSIVYLTPWFSQYIASFFGLQLYTLVILTIGIFQLFMAFTHSTTIKNERAYPDDSGSTAFMIRFYDGIQCIVTFLAGFLSFSSNLQKNLQVFLFPRNQADRHKNEFTK